MLPHFRRQIIRQLRVKVVGPIEDSPPGSECAEHFFAKIAWRFLFEEYSDDARPPCHIIDKQASVGPDLFAS
jgi:hypothetical protein